MKNTRFKYIGTFLFFLMVVLALISGYYQFSMNKDIDIAPEKQNMKLETYLVLSK